MQPECIVVYKDTQNNQIFSLFFFNDTATTEIYTLSLHDALPIWRFRSGELPDSRRVSTRVFGRFREIDRKSTRLNSSHGYISYAVFCLKKKNTHHKPHHYLRTHSTDENDTTRILQRTRDEQRPPT